MAARRKRRAAARQGARHWLAWWAGSMLLWLLLTSTVNPSEAIVGAGASAIAATVAEVLRRTSPIGFRPDPRWFLMARRIPAAIVTDTWTVARALVLHVLGIRRVRGTLRAVPFEHGPEGDPRADARRALATIAVTSTPNTFVIGIDPERNEMLVHQLQPQPDDLTRLLGRP